MIVLSGADGAGKSTLIRHIQSNLSSNGVQISWRRSGGVGRRIMNLIARLFGWSYYEKVNEINYGYSRSHSFRDSVRQTHP